MTIPPMENATIGLFASGPQGTLVWQQGRLTMSEEVWHQLWQLLFQGGGRVMGYVPEGGRREFRSIHALMDNSYVAVTVLTGLGMSVKKYFRDGTSALIDAQA